jgi:hypothetical protein
MLSINHAIETITLNVELIGSVFSDEYSYPNLRSITMYLLHQWQIELNVENELPSVVIGSALNVLQKCSFTMVSRDFLHVFDFNQMIQILDSTLVRKSIMFINNFQYEYILDY